MSNGCGCESGVLKYIKPPYAKYFDLPCREHDDAYDMGGNEKMRQRADKWLFRGCFGTVYEKETNPWKMVWLSLIALFYYTSVRLFGFMFFNYTD